MDLWALKPGDKVETEDGTQAEVLTETEDGEWIKVRYLDSEDDPLFAGTEDLVHCEEIKSLVGA